MAGAGADRSSSGATTVWVPLKTTVEAVPPSVAAVASATGSDGHTHAEPDDLLHAAPTAPGCTVSVVAVTACQAWPDGRAAAAADAGAGCPEHASPTGEGGMCTCDSGYKPTADAQGCESACPLHSSLSASGACACEAGYTVNEAQTECVPNTPA